MEKDIRITLVRSIIGRPEKHRRVIKGLGLGKTNSAVVRKATVEILGMVDKVNYLLRVEDAR